MHLYDNWEYQHGSPLFRQQKHTGFTYCKYWDRLSIKKQYTTEEVNKFDFFKKADLLRKDPVTCASHFDHQVQVFINQVLKSSVSHIGKVLDFFYKVEFQIQISNSSSMEIPYTVYFRYQEIKDLLTNL